MFDQLAKQFLGSDQGSSIVNDVAAQTGIGKDQAEVAVEATAEGAAEHLGDAGGLANLLSGGGGLMGLAGSFLGGGGGGGAAGTVPPEVAGKIAEFVAEKTGLSEDVATSVVNAVLPKVIEYAKDKMS